MHYRARESSVIWLLLHETLSFITQPLTQHSSAVNYITLMLFLLTLFVSLYHWHDIGLLLQNILEAKHAALLCNARTSKCFFPKGDVHLLKNVALILTRPRRHESENEDLSVFTS